MKSLTVKYCLMRSICYLTASRWPLEQIVLAVSLLTRNAHYH